MSVIRYGEEGRECEPDFLFKAVLTAKTFWFVHS